MAFQQAWQKTFLMAKTIPDAFFVKNALVMSWFV